MDAMKDPIRRCPPRLLVTLLILLSICAASRPGENPSATTSPILSVPGSQQTAEPKLLLPMQPGSVRFAVIGDSGTGGREQYRIGEAMTKFHSLFPYTFVLMLGDNLYGGEARKDYEKKFERPYNALLAAGVKFYASLGNHDDPKERFYENFNMEGRRYYSFSRGHVRFFALDSTLLDKNQLAWLEAELRRAEETWKICFFHHPIYSSGRRHGSDLALRSLLEPLFIKYRVNAVFSGHDHFYERIRAQKGVYYFVSGSAGKLRRRNIQESYFTAKGYDQDLSYVLVEVAGDNLHFQVNSRAGATVDSGNLPRLTISSEESRP